MSAESEKELDWIKIREEIGYVEESYFEKLARKCKEAPLVPVGCVATVGALGYGLYSFTQGNSRMSQYMMRSRVIAQGFTITVAVISVLSASATSSSSSK